MTDTINRESDERKLYEQKDEFENARSVKRAAKRRKLERKKSRKKNKDNDYDKGTTKTIASKSLGSLSDIWPTVKDA